MMSTRRAHPQKFSQANLKICIIYDFLRINGDPSERPLYKFDTSLWNYNVMPIMFYCMISRS